jgi:integrase/recombinase XerC
MYEIEDFVNFLKLEKKYSQHTCTSYYSDLSQAFEYFELTVDQFSKLTELDYSLLRNFIVYLSSQDLNPRTINRKVSALRRFYTYFLSKSVISIHPLGNHKGSKATQKGFCSLF